jgi:uncharacterized membrane protein YfhO
MTVLSKNTFSEKIQVVTIKEGDYSVPVTYFPGWAATVNGNQILVGPDKNGLINLHLSKGENTIDLKLHNTQIRSIGNLISFITFLGIFLFGLYISKYDKNIK